jgi:peptidyl-prolyl cis-trans isomerase D
MFVGPFEDALFSMNAGEIRGPIKTQFGYHVIQLQEIEAGKLRPFEEVRTELEVEYRKDRSQSIFADEAQKLADLAFASLTELDSVAKELQLPVKTVQGFTREGGGELGAEAGVIDAAFSDEVLVQGRNSPLVTLGEDRALVLRAAAHKAAEPRPLAEVRAQIEAQLRVQAARDAAADKGAKALARLKEGAAWPAVAAEFGLKPVGKRFLVRQDTIAPAAIVRGAFAASTLGVSEDKPHYSSVSTDDGNYAVLAVTAVRQGDPAAEVAAEKTNRSRRAADETGAGEFAAYVAEAERNTKIVRNEKVFE